MKQILIVTEANERVASGHLMECIEIADILRDSGYHVSFLINDDMLAAFQKKIPFSYELYSHDISRGKDIICNALLDGEVDLAIFNFRCIEDELLQYIRERYTGIVLCIDELGHRHLSCDIIVNPMIDTYYHEYTTLEAKLYAGAKYLVLPRHIQDFHGREKAIHNKIQRVCISMGGVDPFGTTVKLAKWIFKVLPTVTVDIVLGGGFPYWSDLEPIIRGNEQIIVHENIDYIYELFFEADLAFCAGGNTLHELACIGTPTIVIPSMPHEFKNGKAFEENGFGLCLPITDELKYIDLKDGVSKLISPLIRRRFMENGKKYSTGMGRIEIKDIVNFILKSDGPT